MRNGRPKIIFHIGGHDFHPVYDQATLVRRWLGDGYWCHSAESLAAFEHISECDLIVFIGMYFSGWEGRYRPPGDVHKRALEKYINSGRPVISCHGAVASYDDWPRFSELIGFAWRGQVPRFAPAENYDCRIVSEEHPMMEGVKDYKVFDAPPIGVGVVPTDMKTTVHCETRWHDRTLPMIVSGQGGRISGAGKTVYIGHGYDIRAFAEDPMRKIWLNTIQWCLTE